MLKMVHNLKGIVNYAPFFICVPGMALVLLVKVQSRVFTAKCSELQAVRSNPMGEGRC